MANNRQVEQPQGPVTPEMVNETIMELYGRFGGLDQNPGMAHQMQRQLKTAMEQGDEKLVKNLIGKFYKIGISPTEIQGMMEGTYDLSQREEREGDAFNLGNLIRHKLSAGRLGRDREEQFLSSGQGDEKRNALVDVLRNLLGGGAAIRGIGAGEAIPNDYLGQISTNQAAEVRAIRRGDI